MTRVLYTGDMGMVTMKVCSWCMSRLGGSPAVANRHTPPRRGCSSARAAGTAHSPTTSTTLSMSPMTLQRSMTVPPVYKLHQHLKLSPQGHLASHAGAENKGSTVESTPCR